MARYGPMNLVIGNGLIGGALAKRFHDIPLSGTFALRGDFPTCMTLRPQDCVFLCAGVSGYEACQGNREAYRVNVDGTIQLAQQVIRQGAFFVFLSTLAIEWGDGSDYTRHKAIVEIVLHSMGPHAVIRPTHKITAANVADFVPMLADIGINRRAGVHRIP